MGSAVTQERKKAMLDHIDLAHTISKQEYKARLPDLQMRLYAIERAVQQAGVPVLILFEGWAGTSKIGAISALTRRLDPRGLRVHPITPPRTFEQQYPWLYRFWLKIPSYGQIALFDRSWYREVLAERTHEDSTPEMWRQRCEDIVTFERQLADDGTLILKFWLHISREEQERRFEELQSDPLTAWQVTDEDRWQNRHYKRVRVAVEDMLTRTDTPHARWIVLPATDRRALHLTIAETIERALDARLDNIANAQEQIHDAQQNGHADNSVPPLSSGMAQLPVPSILNQVNLSYTLEKEEYSKKLKKLQAKLYLLGLEIYRQQRPVVLLFEGWDAAGKGGAIQRITTRLDPRAYVVHTIAAPTGEDRLHHYLYRFWRRLPARGQIGIFDRSWYGRVLVERVEGFARTDEWQRAYAEINEFERDLIDFGMVVCKFWMHISPDEQLRRFEERQTVEYKKWKLTDEDWRNREKWADYEQAADEMLVRTSTPAAPWTIVEAENKRFGRIKVLQTVVQRLEDELGRVEL
jgi:polyphosphate:AMP phosphotransferase